MLNASRLFAAAAVLVGGAFAFHRATAQEPGQEPGIPGMDAEMMAQMIELATPGEMHELIATMAGDWELEMEMWMDPSAPPMTMTGTATGKMILGGRYLQERVFGEMMGEPFEGMNVFGYDNNLKVFNSVWIDSASTWPTFSTGTWDEATKTLELKGTMRDVANLEGRPYRETLQWTGKGTHELTMYDTIPPLGEVKVMHIVYRRAK